MGAQNFSQQITGLQAGTTYHYRITATNAAGTYQTEDLTFTTAAATFSPLDIDWAGAWWADQAGNIGDTPTTIPDASGHDLTATGAGSVVSFATGRKALRGQWTTGQISERRTWSLFLVAQQTGVNYRGTPIVLWTTNSYYLAAEAAPTGWWVPGQGANNLVSGVVATADRYYIAVSTLNGAAGGQIAVSKPTADATDDNTILVNEVDFGTVADIAFVGLFAGDLFDDPLFDDLCVWAETYYDITRRT